MPLDPEVARLLEKVAQAGQPEYWQMTVQQAREWHHRKAATLDISPVTIQRSEDYEIAGPGGPIGVRVYTPSPSMDRMPALLWLHGGGHVVGSLASYDALCRMLAVKGNCIVVAVDYRLAPEHKFPAGVLDSFAALTWLATHGVSLGVDTSRMAIGGDSAGANLAAVCAILARDQHVPGIVFQLLIYPRTAPEENSVSHQRYADGHLLTRKTILWFHNHYRGSEADRSDFRYAPLICSDLSKLPPARVIVGECDPLHDDGVAYALALRAAGSDATLTDYGGMVHPFFSMGGVLATARLAHDEAASALRSAFGHA